MFLTCKRPFFIVENKFLVTDVSLMKTIWYHGYEIPKQALETYFSSKLRGIQPSAFGGIIQLADITALRL